MKQENTFLYKKSIAVLLLGAVVVGGLGGVPYVYGEEVNETELVEEVQQEESGNGQATTTEEETQNASNATDTDSEILPEDTSSSSSNSSVPESSDEYEGTFLTAAMSADFTSSSTNAAATTSTSTQGTSQSETDNATLESTTTASTTKIESGTAVALANIINIVNSNFINSDGVVFFSNFLETITEALDLRILYNTIAGFGCSLTSCEDDSTTVNVKNDAFIENVLLLQALTGGNLINGADSGEITTGDAYAGLNLINVANMNFVDSNYLLVTLNAFGDVQNDIIFPSTGSLLSNLAYSPDSADINLTGNASVENDIVLDAESGGNELNTSNGGSVSTGATGATSNVFNQLNSSLIGGQNVTILFRIHGDWVGEVFGAPDDLLWYQSPDGGVVLFDGSGTGGGVEEVGDVSLTSENNASISNKVQVVALTGENRITGTETGVISTGNAYAGANIVNLANGNVVGRNWVLAIINIFGDFKGNIAFGRPDLWVGEIIDAPAKIKNGSTLKTKLTVINNGDSPATNVVLEDDLEEQHLLVRKSSHSYTETDAGTVQFALGSIPSGGAVEVVYETEVTGTGAGQELTSVVTVRARETDNNLTDNTETTTVKTYKGGGGGTRVKEIKRKVITPELTDSSQSDTIQVKRVFDNYSLTAKYPAMRQMIVLRNPTDHVISGVTFEDVLKNSNGAVIQTEVWDLGDVLAGEEIELGYTLSFAQNAPSGIYRLYSRVRTTSGAEDIHENGTIVFSEASHLEEFADSITSIGNVLPDISMAYARVAGVSSDHPKLNTFFFNGDMALPILTNHSMSTVTRQQDAFRDLGGWIERLYAYISSLLSKVTPAIALAWGGVERYKP